VPIAESNPQRIFPGLLQLAEYVTGPPPDGDS
jgi:hypothetical protein